MIFWDTSALLKLYVDEPDAARFRRLAAREEAILIAAFTRHELHCGLWRKEYLKGLKPGAAELLYQDVSRAIEGGFLQTIPYNEHVERRVREVIQRCYRARKAVVLRSLDALQLGSALAVGAHELVTTDERMRAGAAIVGLNVLPVS